MTYTLINAAVVGFELARLPAGPTIAQALLTALTADADTLLDLATSRPPRSHSPQPTPAENQLRSIAAQIDHDTTPQELVALLRSSRLDGPHALERLIRHELLGPDCQQATSTGSWLCQLAADRIVDTALTAWAIDTGSTDTHPRSGTPGAVPNLPAHHTGAAALGPQTAAIVDLLDSLAVPATRAVWKAARPADPTAWADAMHGACWAAHLSGRIRAAAHAQLLGVLAFRAAGFGPTEVASGSWNALSGVLQAAVVADLLDEPTRAVLLAPATAHDAAAH